MLSAQHLKAQFTNIPVTGFNQDVVAEGTATSTSTTTSDLDGYGYILLSSLIMQSPMRPDISPKILIRIFGNGSALFGSRFRRRTAEPMPAMLTQGLWSFMSGRDSLLSR